jgi:hypothetical protein
MWVALRDDHLVARAAWWGDAAEAVPHMLDILDLDDDADDRAERVDAGARLLSTAMTAILPPGGQPPEYGRQVPPDWRDHEPSRRVVEDRMAAAARTGAELFVERLRLEWRPGTPVPAPTGRLRFRSLRDTDELLALMTEAMDGTLDAHSRRDLTLMSAQDAARDHFEGELAQQISPRSWWRVATTPDGEPIGFVLPGRNHYNPVIGYLAVLPRHRGNGYIDEILAEGMRVLHAQDVPRMRAATDLGNEPMSRAFARAGWTTFQRMINMTWPDPAAPAG